MKPIGPYVAVQDLPGAASSPVRTLRATDRLTGMPVLLHVLPYALSLPELPDHPHLLPIVDSGMDGEQAYVVTELPPGAQMVGAPVADALATARGALVALSALHGRGHTHGGIGPAQLWRVGGEVALAGAGLPWRDQPGTAQDDLRDLARTLHELGSLPEVLRPLLDNPATLSAQAALDLLSRPETPEAQEIPQVREAPQTQTEPAQSRPAHSTPAHSTPAQLPRSTPAEAMTAPASLTPEIPAPATLAPVTSAPAQTRPEVALSETASPEAASPEVEAALPESAGPVRPVPPPAWPGEEATQAEEKAEEPPLPLAQQAGKPGKRGSKKRPQPVVPAEPEVAPQESGPAQPVPDAHPRPAPEPADPTTSSSTRPEAAQPRPAQPEPGPSAPSNTEAAAHDGTPIVLADSAPAKSLPPEAAQAAAEQTVQEGRGIVPGSGSGQPDQPPAGAPRAPVSPFSTAPAGALETPQERRKRQNEERRAQAMLDAKAAAERKAKRLKAEAEARKAQQGDRPPTIQIGFRGAQAADLPDDLPDWPGEEHSGSGAVGTGAGQGTGAGKGRLQMRDVERLPASLRRPADDLPPAPDPEPLVQDSGYLPSRRAPGEPIRIGWDEDDSWRVVKTAPAPPPSPAAFRLPRWVLPLLALALLLGGGLWALRNSNLSPAPAARVCCDVTFAVQGAPDVSAYLMVEQAPAAANLPRNHRLGTAPGVVRFPVEGAYTLRIEAAGYNATTLKITVPHSETFTIGLGE